MHKLTCFRIVTSFGPRRFSFSIWIFISLVNLELIGFFQSGISTFWVNLDFLGFFQSGLLSVWMPRSRAASSRVKQGKSRDKTNARHYTLILICSFCLVIITTIAFIYLNDIYNLIHKAPNYKEFDNIIKTNLNCWKKVGWYIPRKKMYKHKHTCVNTTSQQRSHWNHGPSRCRCTLFN